MHERIGMVQVDITPRLELLLKLRGDPKVISIALNDALAHDLMNKLADGLRRQEAVFGLETQ